MASRTSFLCSLALIALTAFSSIRSESAIEIPVEDVAVQSNDDAIYPYQRIDIAKYALKVPNNFYSQGAPNGEDAKNIMVLKNVEFGVLGASNISVGLTLDEAVLDEQIEFRIDGENGPIISRVPINSQVLDATAVVNATVQSVRGSHDLYVVYSQGLASANVSWFEFEVAGPDPSAYYALLSSFNGLAIGAVSGTKDDGARVADVPFTYGQHQMLKFEKSGCDSYYISFSHSGKYLEVGKDVYNEGSWAIHRYRRSANDTPQVQQWFIDASGAGSVKIMSRHNGLCLTSASNGLTMYRCTLDSNRRFFFVPIC